MRDNRHIVLTACCLIGNIVCLNPGRLDAQSAVPVDQNPTLLETGPSRFLAPDAQIKIAQAYGKLPVSFELNMGQVDPRVKFVSHGGGYDLFLTADEAVLTLVTDDSDDTKPMRFLESRRGPFRRRRRRVASSGSTLRFQMVGADLQAKINGSDELPGKTSYFIGNDSAKWRTGIPSYSRVRYSNVYPGIDLIFYGDQRQLEYDLSVAPNADPEKIALRIDGASQIRIDETGNLSIDVDGGRVQMRKPVVYQGSGPSRHAVEGGYILTAENTIKFSIGSYDRTQPLTIDPAVDYSTYLGGTADDWANSIAVDASGDAFVAGRTLSTDFPISSGPFQSTNKSPTNGTIFLTEMNPTGTAVLYSTYIGGSVGQEAFWISLDSSTPANVYLTGWTCSSDFPTTSNAYLNVFTPQACSLGNPVYTTMFVTKLNPALSGTSALVYSTYLGGNADEVGQGIAVDSSGNIYVTGSTFSTNFPVTSGAFQTSIRGNLGNAFLTRLDPSKSGSASLIYSTYLGGTGQAASGTGDVGFGVKVDATSNAYVTGYTGSTDFPTTASAFMQSFPTGGGGPAFLSKINTAGTGSSSLVYSSFLGGTGADIGVSLALGPSNFTYITGGTSSSDFPVTTGAYLTTAPTNTTANGVAFLSVIDTGESGENSLIYSSYLGGTNGDYGSGIAVDSSGYAYIAGVTLSTDFPTTAGTYQTTFAGCGSGFISELLPLGNGSADLAYSSFYDGTEGVSVCSAGTVGAFDIALDSSANAYLTGLTGATNFPIAPANAFQTTLKGPSDAYIAKLTVTPKVLPVPAITTLSLTSGITGTSVTITGSQFNMEQGAGTVMFGTVSAFVQSWSATSIVALVPIEGTSGSVQVVVHTQFGTTNSKPFTVLPTITSLSSSSGPVGASVTISGYNFGSTGAVTFNGASASITSWSAQSIIAKVPSGATTGNLIVTSNSVSSPTGLVFTVVPIPSISGLSASSGVSGAQITISGSNFGSSQPLEAGAVVFNGANAFVVGWSSGSILALVPNSATPGTGGITVTVGGVPSNVFPFTVNPSVTSLLPYAGVVGQSINISGADFGTTQGTVKFGATTATISTWSPTQVSVIVPSLPIGAVALTVTAGSIATNSLFFTVSGASGTAPPAGPPVPGLPPFGSFGGGPDQINLANLNVHVDVPVMTKQGRGTPFSYTLKYDSSVWYPTGPSGNIKWQPANNWGWAGQSSVIFGSVSYLVSVAGTCAADGKAYSVYYGWSYQDKLGISHPFNVAGVSSDANCGTNTQSGTTMDGTGYSLAITAVPNTTPQTFVATVMSKTGRQFNPPVSSSTASSSYTDRNGNQLTLSTSGVFTDTLGTTVLTASGSAPSPVKYAYTPPAGGTVYVTVSYVTYPIQTKFNCTGIAEYSNAGIPLVDRVTYPDGSFYQFKYELTPGSTTTYTGRVASVTLPTGGSITYTYQGANNGIVCSDGSTLSFKRTTTDTGTKFWNYSRAIGTSAASTTTITDPTTQANVTVVQFQGIYETERQSYNGSVSSSNLLKTITTCYNGVASNCNSAVIAQPILQRSVTTQLAGPKSLTAGHIYRYDAYQNALEQDDYDYGSGSVGPLLKKTTISYAALGNNIMGFPQQTTTTDASGAIVAQTQYTYDQGAVTATSGTPQHVAVTGSRGNLTSVKTYTLASTFLTKSFTYFDTGNVKTATDVNGAQTTYTYGACGNSFPTTVSEPLSLSSTMTWNCTGAVQTSLTDANLQLWSTSYTTDPFFWRPNSQTDPTNAVTSFTHTSATQSETVLPIVSGSSAIDTVSFLDAMGRAHLGQVRQAPGGTTFDTMEDDFDVEGRPSRETLPFGATLGQGSASAYGKTTIYDSLGRVSNITDSGGGYTTFSYSQNDALTTRGPAPTGQNAETHQQEFDALGRITSVCEVTGATGSGACGQSNGKSGYWTKYRYDALGHLIGVTQNAQSGSQTQTRTYTFDLLGRMTSAKDPETGNLAYTYTYDTDPVCGTYNGDLVKKSDPVGNVVCFSYDAIHRQLSVTYPSGSYATKTPSKYFVYDSATVNGVTMVNAKTKLAEAYTCVAPCPAKLTDIGESYTVRGEPSDIYEKTPNSGAYYHVSEQYWPNGVMKQLSGLTSLPTFTFTVDGEGRTYKVSASSGQNPVTNTVFNNASLATGVTFGSADSDNITYDSKTNRMTQYQFSVNSHTLNGALTWNANATLRSLNIADALNSADNQSCSFLYDDLARLASTDCGTVYSQTYAYDAFGNIRKSGNASFLPTYSPTTNRITSVAGFTPTYDNDGNTLTDPVHTYSWDSAGKPVTIDSVNMTYDALGRVAEQNRSGAFTQFVYGPHGAKLAIFSGQSLQKAFIPLTGGAQAVYNASGILYYGHSDHLGSVRLGSTSTRTVAFDVAYAPFGETYAASGATDVSFTGQRQDTVNGLYDFAAREYNPQGRWPSPDPSGIASLKSADPQTLNRFAYARNTPTSLVDPFGLESCDAVTGEDCFDDSGNNNAGGDQFFAPTGPGDQGSSLTIVVSNQFYSDNYSVIVTPNDSNPAPAPTTIETQTAPTPGFQDCSCLAGQFTPQDWAILSSASDTVEAATAAVTAATVAVATGGVALELLEAGGSTTGALAPTAETVGTYTDALGLTDTFNVSGDAIYGSQVASAGSDGVISLSNAAFSSEETLVQSLVEESTHLSQYAAQQATQGVVSTAVGGVAPLEAQAGAVAKLVYGLFKAAGGLP
jgi:RHS repeat-associated protein